MTTRHEIAMLVDGDNLRGHSWSTLLDGARAFGRLAVARLYMDFQTLSDGGHAARAAGFEPVHVLGKRSTTGFKSMVDVSLATDAMAILYDNPSITALVIGTGDADFIPVLRHWKRRGKHTVVMSNAHQLSTELRHAADEIVTFGQKRRERASGRPATTAPRATRAALRDAIITLAGKTRITDRETNQPLIRLDWLLGELHENLPGSADVAADANALREFVRREVPTLEPIDAKANSFLVGTVASTDSNGDADEIFGIFAELCREVLPSDGTWTPASVVYNEGKRLLEEGTEYELPANRTAGWFRQLLEKTPGVELRLTEGGHMELKRAR
jgi:uncharacterized protein (TIGR00288 family)